MVSLIRNTLFGNLDTTKDSEGNVDIPGSFTEEEALQKFRHALESETDPNISFDDAALLRFLRVKSFKIPDAVKLVNRSEELKRKNVDFFKIPFYKCKTSWDSGHLVVLRQRDLHGRRVIVFRTKYWYPAENPLDHVLRLTHYVLEELLLSKETQIKGIVCIFDNSDVSITRMAQMLTYFTFGQLSRIISFCQGGFPMKLKGLHVIPTQVIVASTYQAVKFLMTKKMRNRVHIHTGSPTSLHKHLGKQNLPDFLEGEVPFENCVDQDLNKKVTKNHTEKESYFTTLGILPKVLSRFSCVAHFWNPDYMSTSPTYNIKDMFAH